MRKVDIFETANGRFGVYRFQLEHMWTEIHQQNPGVKWNTGGRPRKNPKIKTTNNPKITPEWLGATFWLSILRCEIVRTVIQ